MVVVCTDLSGKRLDRQGVNRVMKSGNLTGGMVSIPAQNTRVVGLYSALTIIFPILIIAATPIGVACMQYKLCAVLLLNLPCVCKCKCIACMHIIVSSLESLLRSGYAGYALI